MPKETIVIRKETTGRDNYRDNENCVLAQALKAAGWSKVKVGGVTWDGNKDGNEVVNARIPENIIRSVKSWTLKKQKKDIELEIEYNVKLI